MNKPKLNIETESNRHFFLFKANMNFWWSVTNISIVLCLSWVIV